MKLRRVLLPQQRASLRARFIQLASGGICQGKIVAVVVRRWINLLRALQEGNRFRNSAGAHVEFAHVVIGIEAARLEFDRFAELDSSQIHFSEPRKIRRKVGSCRGGLRVQPHRLLEPRVRFGILGLSGVNESQEFVYLKAVGNFAQKALQTAGGFGKFSVVVLGQSGLKGAVEAFLLRETACGGNCHSP